MRRICVLMCWLLPFAATPALAADREDAGHLLATHGLREPGTLERLPAVEPPTGEPSTIEQSTVERPTIAPLIDLQSRADEDAVESDCETCDADSVKSWYWRIAYFKFVERDGDYWLNKDEGLVPTIGYLRRQEQRRRRFEFFASQLAFDAYSPDHNGYYDPVWGHTTYVGGRVEFDRFFVTRPESRREWLLGIGTRMWNRNGPYDSFFQQFWLSLYPYLGLERRHDPAKRVEWFYRTRIGLTAFTYELAATHPSSGFYPAPGIDSLVEFGVRKKRGFVSGYFETFTWNSSQEIRGDRQHAAGNVMAGVQCGFFR